MRFLSLLGGIFDKVVKNGDAYNKPFDSDALKWLGDIVLFLGEILVPITIVILAAGVVWCIYLGIQLARAEDASKAGEVKKRLINVAVAFLVTLVAIWIIALLMTYVPTWFAKNYVDDPDKTTKTTTMIETAIRSSLPRL